MATTYIPINLKDNFYSTVVISYFNALRYAIIHAVASPISITQLGTSRRFCKLAGAPGAEDSHDAKAAVEKNHGVCDQALH
jgi:hypothetical protein